MTAPGDSTGHPGQPVRPVTVQLIRRHKADRYGAHRARGSTRLRPIETRNGLPVRHYVYRGTGRSMTFSEAKECLLCSD